MKRSLIGKLPLGFALIMLAGTVSVATAAGGDLGVGTTSLGNIIVDGKGMTAYYYQPDVPNSGVSTCTGGCLVHWPAITSASATPVVSGITATVTVIASSSQIVVNGRPIYTFAGDSKPGDVNGQGIAGIWYVVSPAGVELTPSEIAKEKSAATPKPKATKPAKKPKAKAKHKVVPKPKKTSGASYYGK
ncbi:MAG TPA: hypothetical protein VIH79_05155 [Candidatus Nanopelagicaceae bacterium]